MDNSDTSPGDRIREARETRGLTAHAVASAAGLNDNWYRDVEQDSSEVTSNVSLRQLGIIARTVGLQPLAVLEGHTAARPTHRLTIYEMKSLALARLSETGLSADAYGDLVEWDMARIFADPTRLRDYTIDALRDICRDLRIDWREVLDDATAPDDEPLRG